MHRGSVLAQSSYHPMFPKTLSVFLLAFFALSAAASPETQAIGDPCSATQVAIVVSRVSAASSLTAEPASRRHALERLLDGLSQVSSQSNPYPLNE
ncbi:hypothetical protein C8R47DRAFT_1223823 [Mycena vitilis]|nr:hypothetical protein C8R47DRAFT_1223823 [Mycena vitilis]